MYRKGFLYSKAGVIERGKAKNVYLYWVRDSRNKFSWWRKRRGVSEEWSKTDK